jgi:hypothetical protein
MGSLGTEIDLINTALIIIHIRLSKSLVEVICMQHVLEY